MMLYWTLNLLKGACLRISNPGRVRHPSSRKITRKGYRQKYLLVEASGVEYMFEAKFAEAEVRATFSVTVSCSLR